MCSGEEAGVRHLRSKAGAATTSDVLIEGAFTFTTRCFYIQCQCV
jgi:hypothetical protein